MKRALVAMAALAAACGSDVCKDEVPSLQVDIRAPTALGAAVRSLDVQLNVGGETFTRTFTVDTELADGETAFAVELGNRVAGPETVAVVVQASGDDGALGGGQTSIEVGPDGCNRASVSLEAVDATCGDGTRAGVEQCDGTDFGGLSCAAYGVLAGNGGLGCNTDCTIDTSGCAGGPIDSVPDIEAALGEPIVRIQSGTYAVQGPLAASGTIEPLDGPVTFTGDTIFTVSAGQTVLRGFAFDDVLTAVRIEAADVVFEGHRLTNATRAPGVLVDVRASRAVVSKNLFENTAGAGTSAVLVGNGASASIRMNVVSGPFARQLDLNGVEGTNAIDHNSLSDSGGGTAMRFDARPNIDICLRNNAITIAAGSTGYDVGNQVRFKACGGPATDNNAVGGGGNACTGRCNDCNEGALCTWTDDPGLVGADLCLPGGSPLIDAGVDVGVDLVDGEGATFRGASPDVGARESGTTRSFGGVDSSCP